MNSVYTIDNSFFYYFLLIIIIVGLGLYVKSKRISRQDLPYKKREFLMTRAEKEFFGVLEQVVNNHYYIAPQVKISNLAFVSEGKNRQMYLNKIDRKTIDFVLFDKQFSPVLAIELDDGSHNNESRKNRDDFVDEVMRTIGLKIIHIKTASSYNLKEINNLISKQYGQ